jgi:acetyltransferase
MIEDAQFGPVLLFGHGGVAVERLADSALALPPLNIKLAHELIKMTRVYRLLTGYRNQPKADIDSIALTLVKLSQLVVDVPEIVELDINPLLADQHGVVALDARMKVRAAKGVPRLAIRPYPRKLEGTVEDASGRTFMIRPILPEDEPEIQALIGRLSPRAIRLRFFAPLKTLTHIDAARLTQIDYDREMAFIAVATNPESMQEILGVVRAAVEAARSCAEFAIIVRSDMKGRGLGQLLLEKMIRYCRERGLQVLRGQALAGNTRMIDLARRLGFTVGDAEGGVVSLELQVTAHDV